MRKYLNLKANIALGLIFAFLANTLGPAPFAQAQEFHLPAPGVMVPLSPTFNPPILKGIKVHPDNPFRFDFILDQGDLSGSVIAGVAKQSSIKQESTKLIKYFLASLTLPEKDLWVNLSPYEKDRIIPQSFGSTEMGRDLLAEDYMLKQITASLIYPEDETGKKFWKRIYEEAAKRFGTTDVPVNTFNKVWIVPDKAVVYENLKAGTAYVTESRLKVMLEQDYLALSHTVIPAKAGIHNKNDISTLGSQIVKEIVIPELTKEVNQDKNFVQLRQVYNSLILAIWYKKKIKDSILAQVYEDRKKIAGIGYESSVIARSPKGDAAIFDTEKIYQHYLQAFKKGAYNYIKEEQDPLSKEMIARKYFSGGFDAAAVVNILRTTNTINLNPGNNHAMLINVRLSFSTNEAMASAVEPAYQLSKNATEILSRNETEVKKELGALILEALPYDLDIDLNNLESLKNNLRLFREKGFHFELPAGFRLSPKRRQIISFSGLQPHREYSIQPYWEENAGLVIYFVSAGDVIGFSIDRYREALNRDISKGGNQIIYQAQMDVRAENLDLARNDAKVNLERLFHYIQDYHFKDGKFEYIEMLKESLLKFRKQKYVLPKRDALRSIRGFEITPQRNKWLSFGKVSPKLPYMILPYWQENLGLRVYFWGSGDTQRYEIGDYFNDTTQKKDFSAPLKVEGKTFAEVFHDPREDFEFLINAWLHYLQAPSDEAIGKFKQIIKFYERKQLKIKASSGGEIVKTGMYGLTPVDKFPISFHRLKPNEEYRVTPYYDQSLGFFLIFQGAGEVIVFDINGYASLQNPDFNAKLIFRAATYTEAVNMMGRVLLAQIIGDSLTLAGKPDNAEERIAFIKKLFSFCERDYIFTSDKWGKIRFKLKGDHEIIFDGVEPETNYKMLIFWEEGIGLRIYLMGKKNVLKYSVGPHKQGQADAAPFVIRFKGKFPSLDEARGDSKDALAGLINRLEKINVNADEDTVPKEYEQELEHFRRNAYIIVTGEGEKSTGLSSWSSTPSTGKRIQFKNLNPHETYFILPFWEKGIGLRLYFVGVNGIIAYEISRYFNSAGSGNLARIRLRTADDIQEAREQLRNVEYLLRSGLGKNLVSPGEYLHFRQREDGEQGFVMENIVSHTDTFRAAESLIIQNILEKQKYSQEETVWLLDIAGEMIDDGYMFDEAVERSHVSVSRIAWLRDQWYEVLPKIFSSFSVDAAMVENDSAMTGTLMDEGGKRKGLEQFRDFIDNNLDKITLNPQVITERFNYNKDFIALLIKLKERVARVRQKLYFISIIGIRQIGNDILEENGMPVKRPTAEEEINRYVESLAYETSRHPPEWSLDDVRMHEGYRSPEFSEFFPQAVGVSDVNEVHRRAEVFLESKKINKIQSWARKILGLEHADHLTPAIIRAKKAELFRKYHPYKDPQEDPHFVDQKKIEIIRIIEKAADELTQSLPANKAMLTPDGKDNELVQKEEKANAAEVPIEDEPGMDRGFEPLAKQVIHTTPAQVLNPPTPEEILGARGILDLPLKGMADLDEETILWARLNKELANASNNNKLKGIDDAANLLIRSLRREDQAMAVPEADALKERNSARIARNGGIDFTANKISVEMNNTGEDIKFKIDPAMLQQLQKSSGAMPVIISIEPVMDVRKFLGASG